MFGVGVGADVKIEGLPGDTLAHENDREQGKRNKREPMLQPKWLRMHELGLNMCLKSFCFLGATRQRRVHSKNDSEWMNRLLRQFGVCE